jgi:putative transposase
MSEHNLLLLHDKPERSKREHKGKIAVAESDMRWCSDGFEFGCDNGEKLRVTFALDCCDREAIDWAASTGGYDSSTVQDVMLRSVEKRFGLPTTPVQWLTDNGSAYTAHETRRFARELNLEPCTTAVSSPQSNGMAERFVKTMKEDYIAFMPKPDVRTALRNLAAAFTHYNENHPHSALGYHFEGISAAADIVNLRYKSCPEMAGQDHLSASRFFLGTVRITIMFLQHAHIKIVIKSLLKSALISFHGQQVISVFFKDLLRDFLWHPIASIVTKKPDISSS